MSQPAEPNRATVKGPADVRWDTSTMASQFCDVTSITARGNELVLNFGVVQQSGSQPAELAVSLKRQVALRPMTARNLRDMLRNLIAEIDANPSADRA